MGTDKFIAFLLLTIGFSMLFKYGRIFIETYKKVSSKQDNFKCAENCEDCNNKCENMVGAMYAIIVCAMNVFSH